MSIMVIALAAGSSYSAQSTQSTQSPWSHSRNDSTPATDTGQSSVQKRGGKDSTPPQSEQDEKQDGNRKSSERMEIMKNNTILMMRGIAEITQGLVRMLEKDMSLESMTKIASLMKDISLEMGEMQNMISKGSASDDELVTLRLKIDVTKKKMEQIK